MARPVSVTVVCWIIIVVALEAIAGSLSSFVQTALSQVLTGPVSISTAAAVGAGMKAAEAILAVCMLRGMGWSRVVYTCLAIFMVAGVLLETVKHSALAPVAVFATLRTIAILIVLFQKPANRYFANSKMPSLGTGDAQQAVQQDGP